MVLGALDTTRDLIVIIWGVISILTFLFMLLFLLFLWRGVNKLIGSVNIVVNDDIRPMLVTSRESLNNVTGTTRFLSDTIAQPVIRLYGIIAGVRRGIGVFSGVTGRGRKDKK